MTGKIFRFSFLVGALALLLCAALFFALQYRRNIDDAYTTLRQEAAYVAQGVSQDGADYLKELPTDKQITWLDENGDVLYDSQVKSLPNQKAFSEVSSALRDGSGEATRESGSKGVSTMYYAQKLPDGTVIRIANPVSAAQSALIAVSPVLWVFVLVLTLSGVLAFRAAKQIVHPINVMDLDDPKEKMIYPELKPLVTRLQEQKLTIDDQIELLNRRQKEFSALTDNMSEGFLMLDHEGVVLSANARALQLLPEAAVGEKLDLPENTEAGEAARRALAGNRHESVFTQSGRSWQIIANPVLSHKHIVGAVLLLMDVTEREQRERLRQEFSANVSHELKTPLTSISGFAELLAQGTVPQQKVVEFAKDIHSEASRLIALVEDIMKLSKLDENAQFPAKEPVDLYALAEETMDSLRSVAKRSKIEMTLSGEHVKVPGVWQLLSEMVYNLCDNAIKYNREGGTVAVTVKNTENGASLSVRDTGIGIPPAEQRQVFERFYRVDKSHSKRIGGTGLGLSIVKHGAQYHNAQVKLESKLGEGTTITLLFPQEDVLTEE